jgi:predicted nucleic acid-binding protein
MEIFVDTSALYALASKKDSYNETAADIWERLVGEDTQLVTNNYVLVECISLLQSRLGLSSVNYLQSEIVSLLAIEWVEEEQHATAMDHVLATNRRNLSLVDCASFNTMRRLGIETVFTFDEHFRERGFSVIP